MRWLASVCAEGKTGNCSRIPQHFKHFKRSNLWWEKQPRIQFDENRKENVKEHKGKREEREKNKECGFVVLPKTTEQMIDANDLRKYW
jgi:thiamine biosynthesis protein ThiC